MVKKGIVDRLVHMLERHNFEFLVLMITFLKRLSIYAENKDRVSPAAYELLLFGGGVCG